MAGHFEPTNSLKLRIRLGGTQLFNGQVTDTPDKYPYYGSIFYVVPNLHPDLVIGKELIFSAGLLDTQVLELHRRIEGVISPVPVRDGTAGDDSPYQNSSQRDIGEDSIYMVLKYADGFSDALFKVVTEISQLVQDERSRRQAEE